MSDNKQYWLQAFALAMLVILLSIMSIAEPTRAGTFVRIPLTTSLSYLNMEFYCPTPAELNAYRLAHPPLNPNK